jgi:hypothetical protein
MGIVQHHHVGRGDFQIADAAVGLTVLGPIPLVKERLDEDFRAVGDAVFELVDGEIGRASVLVPFKLESCTDKAVTLFAQLGGFGFENEVRLLGICFLREAPEQPLGSLR